MVNYKPENWQAVIPFMVCDDTARVIDFVKKTFAADEIEMMVGPEGKIKHAELKIDDSILMFSSASDEYGPTKSSHYIYTPDVDAVYKSGLEAGGESLYEPKDQAYGDRMAGLKDKWGNQWWIATHIEDVPPEEIEKRMQEWKAKEAEAK